MSRQSSGRMHPSIPSAYAGGYSEETRRQLERVVLPDKIKCKTCKKIRMQSAFSKRQLEFLINAVVVQGQARALGGPGHAACRACVGGQTVELRCCICDQIKGLEEFAKNQRQEHDTARCINCVQKHAEAEPVLEEHKLLTEGEFSTTYEASLIENGSLERSTAPLNLHNGSCAHTNDEEDDVLSVAGGCWVESERQVENSKYSKGIIERSAYGHPPNSNKRFAKVPGTRFAKTERPMIQVPEPVPPKTYSDDEEDEAGVEDFL